MKCQVAWNWKDSKTELVVSTQKRERLVLAEAEWISKGPSPRLIPATFLYAQAREKHVSVRYGIMGTTKLSKLIKRRRLNGEQVHRLIFGLADAIHCCVCSSMLVDKILFYPDFVYLDEDCNPNFVFVPFTGVTYNPRLSSPFAMLDALSDPKRMNWMSAEGERQRDAVHRFVLSNKVFSANEYAKLIKREFGKSHDAETPSAEVDSSRFQANDSPDLLYMSDLFSSSGNPMVAQKAFGIRRADNGELFRLKPGVNTVMGSAPWCDCVVNGNRFMGQRHLVLCAQNDCVIITDCGTQYGTFAFNRRVLPNAPVRLRNHDCFLVGGEKFVVFTYEGQSI